LTTRQDRGAASALAVDEPHRRTVRKRERLTELDLRHGAFLRLPEIASKGLSRDQGEGKGGRGNEPEIGRSVARELAGTEG
jgi:hypothetical protein